VRMNEDLRFDYGLSVHIASAPNDGGLPVGASWALYPPRREDSRQSTAYLGPVLFDIDDLDNIAQKRRASQVNQSEVSAMLGEHRMLALIRGRTEYGPRALGHRSLIGYPGDGNLKSKMNKLKSRAWYRPVAPVVPREQVHKFFVTNPLDSGEVKCSTSAGKSQCHLASRRTPIQHFNSPYMSFAPPLQDWALHQFPAISHLDGTGRVQTVSNDDCPWFHRLLLELEKHTGAAILANTSCNVRGKPIVNSIVDVLQILDDQDGTDLHAAVIEDYLLFPTTWSA